jgi:hypothetical protein
VAETADHFADSATIAFCGINADNIPHGFTRLKEEIAEFVFSAWQTNIKKLIGSPVLGDFLSIQSEIQGGFINEPRMAQPLIQITLSAF